MASILTLLVGVYVLVLPFAMSLFTRTSDAQELNDYYRSLMSDQGIRQFGTNLRRSSTTRPVSCRRSSCRGWPTISV